MRLQTSKMFYCIFFLDGEEFVGVVQKCKASLVSETGITSEETARALVGRQRVEAASGQKRVHGSFMWSSKR